MKANLYVRVFVVAAASLGLVGFALANPDNSKPLDGLSGRVFAVEAEVLYTLNPDVTGEVGTVFRNCYYFNEDGTWDDPLFPSPSTPVPGVWVQHTELPKIIYTATVPIPEAGFLLIQNGTVNPSRGKAKQRLTAYTAVFASGIPGNGVFSEIESRGRAVDECPYDPFDP